MNLRERLLLWGLHCLLLLCLNVNAWAQGTVTGTIRDEKNIPLPGVTVTVKGTARSTTSDVNGQYSIVASGTDVLQFSSVGFSPKEVDVASRTTIDYVMQPNVVTTDEVVVIGYQTVRRRDLTGAVSSINPNVAQRNVANTVAESLQGLTPGVTVRNSGRPGGGAKIDIRGAGTFAGNNPLYIIDGMYSDATPDFNPQDVESIQVLKDASAAAIYGARAANGVIIITTKQGRQGPLKVTGTIKAGIQELHRRYDMMEVTEYRDLATRLYQAGNQAVPTSLTTEFDPSINTDWQEEFLRRGAIGGYSLST